MSCGPILQRLSDEFDNWSCDKHQSCKDHELQRRARAYEFREAFLRRYPFHRDPSRIATLTAKGLYDPGPGHEYFLRWIVWRLQSLGAIGLHNAKPLRAAAAKIRQFRQLLRIAVDHRKTVANKVDAPWDNILGFGHGDRVAVKKIVYTYFPEDVMPVFNQNHMEHFVGKLGRNGDRDRLSRSRYRKSYKDISCGQKFALLNDILLDSKKHHKALDKEDNVYFMYVLYAGGARPLGMKLWAPHTNQAEPHVPPDPASAVAEVQTGIKRGQRFCESPEARKAIEKRAIDVATQHLSGKGWSVSDVSGENRGYDLHCRKGHERLMVEVKGTTGDGAEVVLTPNEVNHAHGQHPRAVLALIVVTEITLSQEQEGEVRADGGTVKELHPWAIDDGVLTALAYEYAVPYKSGNGASTQATTNLRPLC